MRDSEEISSSRVEFGQFYSKISFKKFQVLEKCLREVVTSTQRFQKDSISREVCNDLMHEKNWKGGSESLVIVCELIIWIVLILFLPDISSVVAQRWYQRDPTVHFPKKPDKGGIPPEDNKHRAKEKVTKGSFIENPPQFSSRGVHLS